MLSLAQVSIEKPISEDQGLRQYTGPAHAVYFGSYEIVKEYAGGNKLDGKHHPLAAASSGAAATVASDALMNPFDGNRETQTSHTLLTSSSRQTTNASPWLHLHLDSALRSFSLPQRGTGRILRIVSDDSMHDRALHRYTVYGLRVIIESHESQERVQSNVALCGWRFSRSVCCRHNYTTRCDQDDATDQGA